MDLPYRQGKYDKLCESEVCIQNGFQKWGFQWEISGDDTIPEAREALL
jgi:hypothetical protein